MRDAAIYRFMKQTETNERLLIKQLTEVTAAHNALVEQLNAAGAVHKAALETRAVEQAIAGGADYQRNTTEEAPVV